MRYFFLFFAVLFTSSSPLFCLSPRLLIQLGPNCDFTPQELGEKIDLVVISEGSISIRESIKELDRSSKIHITLIDSPIENIEDIAEEVRYAHLVLNAPLSQALPELLSFIKTLPLSDADLPRTPPKKVGQFYALMKKVDSIFSLYHLRYWATCGTLLGIARHKGMIPWDDDIDVAILAEDIPLLEDLDRVLAAKGLELYYFKEKDLYKIFPQNGRLIPLPSGEESYPWKYPFIDIFPHIEKDGKISYRAELWQHEYPNEYFFSDELELVRMPYGPMTLPAPTGYLAYLNRAYGDDWNDVAYVQYDHANEKHLNRVKVDLLDHSPPPFILPSK